MQTTSPRTRDERTYEATWTVQAIDRPDESGTELPVPSQRAGRRSEYEPTRHAASVAVASNTADAAMNSGYDLPLSSAH